MTVARVSALTGIAPQALEWVDAPMWRALVTAVDTRWSVVEEMLTFQAELLHELMRITTAANSKPGTRVQPPLRLPRPHDRTEPGQLSSPAQILAFASRRGGARG